MADDSTEENLPDEPHSRKLKFRLSIKLSLGLVLVIGILFAGVNTFNLLEHRKARRSETVANNSTIARIVAGAILEELGQGTDIKSQRIKGLVHTFLEFGLVKNKKNRDLAFAVLIDDKGNLLAGRARPKLTILPGGKTLKDEAEVLKKVAELRGKLPKPMKVIRFPLVISDGGQKEVGKLIVGTSLGRLEREVKEELFANIGILGVSLLLMMGYATLLLRGLIIKPLSQVTRAMQAVHGGDLSHEVEIKTTDEMGLLADNYNFMIAGLREQDRLRDAFNRYVSDKIYKQFQSGEIDLSGETRNATILFSDIRSFTALSERQTPAQVVAMLNEYFSAMVDIVFKYDGFINKFIGDAIMALYNIPVDQDQPELRAVRSALDMIDSLAKLNKAREERGEYPIRIGIGVNTGPVIAGNIGHLQRLEYTVIGDAVNLASRIESQTKVAGTQLLISDSTYQAIKHQVIVEPLPPVKVKGKAEAVMLYMVSGLTEEAKL